MRRFFKRRYSNLLPASVLDERTHDGLRREEGEVRKLEGQKRRDKGERKECKKEREKE